MKEERKENDLSNREVVIKLKNVSKTYRLREKNTNTIRNKIVGLFQPNRVHEIKALQNINLEIYKGEFFGIIGRNGCGKTTLLHIMAGTYAPDKGGESSIKGKYMRLSLGMGFNKEFTARQNIYINASILGLTKKEIDGKFDEMIEFSELEEFTETKVKFFSQGMKSRLTFAIALHADTDILLMDEFFGGVGDEKFKQKAKEVFRKAFIQGRTIVHVSHNLKNVKQYCDRVLLLHKGEQIMIGKPKQVVKKYRELLDR